MLFTQRRSSYWTLVLVLIALVTGSAIFTWNTDPRFFMTKTPKTSFSLAENSLSAQKQSSKEQNGPISLLDPNLVANNLGLDQPTCIHEFPGFYSEIKRALEVTQQHGNITFKDLDTSWKESGLVRALIFQKRLHVIEAKHSGSGYDVRRTVSILSSISRAILMAPESVPDIEFVFSVNDTPGLSYGGHVIWTLTRKLDQESFWLIPDFGYWSWEVDQVGEYSQVRQNMANMEIPFTEKRPQAVWRGAAKTNKLRSNLIEATKGESWADVKDIKWSGRTQLSQDTLNDVLPMWELCKYKYLIQTEGASYSGRGKYLQNCHSITIMHEREWLEHSHPLLISSGPDQNFVQVYRNWTDLGEKVAWLESNPEVAQNIAEQSTSVFRDRYLTPAAQACYWRELFRGWASVSIKPEFYEKDDHGNLRSRGIPYETYILKAFDKELDNCKWLGSLLRLCR